MDEEKGVYTIVITDEKIFRQSLEWLKEIEDLNKKEKRYEQNENGDS